MNYQTDLGAGWVQQSTAQAKALVPQQPKPSLWVRIHTPTVRGIGSVAAAYHGYKRNKSVLWAVAWSVGGWLSPLFTNAIAVAQGYSKPKKGK
jgi:hypothetical protein